MIYLMINYGSSLDDRIQFYHYSNFGKLKFKQINCFYVLDS